MGRVNRDDVMLAVFGLILVGFTAVALRLVLMRHITQQLEKIETDMEDLLERQVEAHNEFLRRVNGSALRGIYNRQTKDVVWLSVVPDEEETDEHRA